METDKKIEDYLERARDIKKKVGNYPVIKIAKMIQLEEHREQK